LFDTQKVHGLLNGLLPDMHQSDFSLNQTLGASNKAGGPGCWQTNIDGNEMMPTESILDELNC